jgi:hypothetical protein
MRRSFGQYIVDVLVAFDQFINVVCGGHPDETISARVGRPGNRFTACIEWALDTIQPHHSAMAIQHDRERAEAVAALERKAET